MRPDLPPHVVEQLERRHQEDLAWIRMLSASKPAAQRIERRFKQHQPSILERVAVLFVLAVTVVVALSLYFGGIPP
jgi:hypothetical protein